MPPAIPTTHQPNHLVRSAIRHEFARSRLAVCMYMVDLLQAVDWAAKCGPERGSAAAFVVRIPLLQLVFTVRRHLLHSEHVISGLKSVCQAFFQRCPLCSNRRRGGVGVGRCTRNTAQVRRQTLSLPDGPRSRSLEVGATSELSVGRSALCAVVLLP